MDTVTLPATPARTDAPPTPETTKPLKLSEAIRLGAMMTEQAFDTFGDQTRTCGLGAAQVALGIPVGSDGPLTELLDETPAIALPCDHRHLLVLAAAVMHLNDEDRWPRERIADWLETIGL